MSWEKTFGQMFGSQNSHNPQKGVKRGGIEDIENKSLKSNFKGFNYYIGSKNSNVSYTKIRSQNPQKESGMKCLGHACGLAEYRFEEGVDRANCKVLWCGRADSAVIDLARCPNGVWMKDAQGRPCMDQKQTNGG
jgi:hypothetical protein